MNRERVEKLRGEFKIRHTAAGTAIVIEVDGHKFDDDEVAQRRMARAILAMNAAGAASTVWVRANNEPTSVTVAQLSHALMLPGLEQSANVWKHESVRLAGDTGGCAVGAAVALVRMAVLHSHAPRPGVQFCGGV